jgi:putative flippase GtrA
MRFLFSGGTALCVNLFLLYAFTDLVGWHYLVSATIAFLGSFVVSFSLHKFWTFGNNSTDWLHGELSLYLLVTLFNLILNNGMLYLFVSKLHIWYLFAQVIVSAIIAVWSFFAYKKLFAVN